MPEIIVRFGDGSFSKEVARTKKLIHLGNDSAPIVVASLEAGMVGGRTSVAFGFELPDGEYVIAETSLRLFLTAADALRARYGSEEN